MDDRSRRMSMASLLAAFGIFDRMSSVRGKQGSRYKRHGYKPAPQPEPKSRTVVAHAPREGARPKLTPALLRKLNRLTIARMEAERQEAIEQRRSERKLRIARAAAGSVAR